LVQGPANKTNTEIIKSLPPTPKSSTQIFGDALTGARTALKQGGLGNAVKAIPGAVAQAGVATDKALAGADAILHRSMAENINGVPKLKAIADGGSKILNQGMKDFSSASAQASTKIGGFGAAVDRVKATQAKQQAAQAIVLKKARENAQKASDAQRQVAQARR
jgi:hypothetical protein